MSTKTLKGFQEMAVQSGVQNVFMRCKELLDAAGGDAASYATAIHTHGYLLLEAPTGAGKTLIAGNIVERFSHEEAVVWFWFAPFKGIVEQTAAFLREEFAGLRLRVLAEDREPGGSRAGDVFVTTWGTVATRVRDRRNVRRTSEQNASIDDFIATLRAQSLRIGVVVDEAHHGFHGDTQAAEFFRAVLKPEYTILITATPDDEDLADLQRRMHLGDLQRITISRDDAVAAGLVKQGVRCIAWQAEPAQEALVDFEGTALAEGTKIHRLLKQTLKDAGISLTPLLLVQVDSKEKGSTDRAKQRLLKLGFTEEQIAVHTAEEPDAGLLALANDEKREVLIFKMAVALGFDAPRAWTLVSMRAAKDADFGVQLVGRILRVHRRVQGRDVPDLLRYGYVLLADAETQGGIALAGERINELRTSYAKVSPTTVIVRVGNRDTVQVLTPNDPTPTFFPVPPAGAVVTDETDFQLEGGLTTPALPMDTLFGDIFPPAVPPPDAHAPAVAGHRFAYPLKTGVPRRFTTQSLPEDFTPTEEECAQRFIVSTAELIDILRGRLQVQKTTLDVFTGLLQAEFAFAAISPDELAVQAQRVLRSDTFDRKALWEALVARLSEILRDQGFGQADEPEQVKRFLDILLVTHPELLRDAQKAALAKGARLEAAEDLPAELVSDSRLEPSRLNIYERMPPGLNSWETAFAKSLDADASGKLLWWHRNPSRKDYSVRILLANGAGFYPDFILGVQGRPTRDGGLLADTKYAFETRRELPKMLAEHGDYGRVLILSLEGKRWCIAKTDAGGRAMLGEEFRIVNAAGY